MNIKKIVTFNSSGRDLIKVFTKRFILGTEFIDFRGLSTLKFLNTLRFNFVDELTKTDMKSTSLNIIRI